MDTEMDDTLQCVVHFAGKGGQQRELTNETLKKILERRQWLDLPGKYGEFSGVAQKIFDYILENVDDCKQQISVINKDAQRLGFHSTCYRCFTDKTKLERAQTTLENANLKRRKECDTQGPQMVTLSSNLCRRRQQDSQTNKHEKQTKNTKLKCNPM